MYAHFKCYDTPRCGISISSIRTHTGSRHTQQRRILAFFLGDAKDTVEAAASGFRLETYLIDIICLGATFRK